MLTSTDPNEQAKKSFLIRTADDPVLAKLAVERMEHFSDISRRGASLNTELSMLKKEADLFQERWWKDVTSRLDELKLLAPNYHADSAQFLNVVEDGSVINLCIRAPRNEVVSRLPKQLLDMLENMGVPDHVIDAAAREAESSVAKMRQAKTEEIVH